MFTVDSLWREAKCEELTVDSSGDMGVYFPLVISSAVDLPWLQTQQVREMFQKPTHIYAGVVDFFHPNSKILQRAPVTCWDLLIQHT